jgi:two-component system chemotaxis response regulator CheB/chemosensory pili system protein ChpB (putative protein-glutamate methylesterase)
VPNPQGQDLRVALLYQAGQFGVHLRDALKELGAVVVYEAPPADIDRDKLEGSGARIVIVNLDADSDTYIDHLYDVLDEGDYEVLFNDAQVSSNLSGWDHARWARNLAAKLLRQPAIATPARPLGAEAVPTPVQKSASFVPVAEKPGEHARELTPNVVAATPKAAAPAPAKAAPPAPSTPVTAAPPDLPTVEMPLPDFAEDAAAKSAVPEAEELDIAAIAEFVYAPEPTAPEPPPVARKPDAAKDFAAELDALFAAAGPADAQAPATDFGGTDFDISLPGEDAPAGATSGIASPNETDAIDIPFDFPGADLPGATAPPATSEPADLHAEFPAIFDHLDAAAASVPEASDGAFKPGQRADAPVEESSEPLLPPEWNLDPFNEEPAAGLPGESAPAFGIEKIAASDYLAPQVESPTAKQAAAIPEGLGLSLELMPMEEAVAPTYQNPNYSKEAWLDGSRPAAKLKVGTGAGIERVFVLGASIGGPEAVREFLGALPAGFPMLFVLAQHMGEEFLELMSAQLAKAVALTVRNPTHGERVSQSEILVVPTTHRMKVDKEGVITLAHLPEKPPYSPSIDQVLRDVADQFGDKAGAIIFSGMAHDAVEGSQYLKSKGGVIWAQDPDTCVISSMVDGAREAGVVSFLGSPKQLAEKMIADYKS